MFLEYLSVLISSLIVSFQIKLLKYFTASYSMVYKKVTEYSLK
jgi:hypothetical protein